MAVAIAALRAVPLRLLVLRPVPLRLIVLRTVRLRLAAASNVNRVGFINSYYEWMHPTSLAPQDVSERPGERAFPRTAHNAEPTIRTSPLLGNCNQTSLGTSSWNQSAIRSTLSLPRDSSRSLMNRRPIASHAVGLFCCAL